MAFAGILEQRWVGFRLALCASQLWRLCMHALSFKTGRRTHLVALGAQIHLKKKPLLQTAAYMNTAHSWRRRWVHKVGRGCENDSGVLQKQHLDMTAQDKFCKLCSTSGQQMQAAWKQSWKLRWKKRSWEAGWSLVTESVNPPLSSCWLWIKYLRSCVVSIFSVKMWKELKLKAFLLSLK